MTRSLALLLLATLVVAPIPLREATAQAPPVRLADVLEAAATRSTDVLTATEAVAVERATLRAAGASFETQLYGSARSGQTQAPLTALQRSGPDALTSGVAYQQYEAGVRRLFRSGIQFSPSIRLYRSTFEAADAILETSAGMSLSYPIISGRARNFERATEEAALRRLSAADLERDRAVETAIAEAALAYWAYVGAIRAAEAALLAEERAVRLYEETAALASADERPAADLIPLRADVLRRHASRERAEHAVFDTRQQLALAIGGTAEDAANLGPPADPLPAIERSSATTSAVDESELIEEALSARADLHAADLRLHALSRELDARIADLRPSVDIVVDAGIAVLSEGPVAAHEYLPLGTGAARGGRVGATVRVNRFGSGVATAAAERLRAEQEGLRLVREDRARRIRADVAAAVAALRSASSEVRQTRDAAALYEEAVENERHRLRMGVGTLFDVRLVEEHLTAARAEALQAEVRYARALVHLHAAIGRLSGRDAVSVAAALRSTPTASPSPRP